MRRFYHVLLGFSFLTFASCATWDWKTRPVDPAASRQLPAFTIPPVQPAVTYERFMVIGDMGTGSPDQHEVAEAMATRALQDGLDFILTVGDNIYEDGVESATDPQWKTKFEDVYADAALQVPYYPSLGNHDDRGNVEAQIEYGLHNPNWKMAARHYTFSRPLGQGSYVQFFAIETTPIYWEREGIEQQLSWLEDQLRNSRARWKIVYGHHPLYTHSIREPCEAVIRHLEPLFVEHGVDVYFAGHDHTLEMLKPIYGVNYVISGAAGGPDKAYPVSWTEEAFYAATLGGFVLCRISADELVIEFVRPDAKTQYAHVLEK